MQSKTQKRKSALARREKNLGQWEKCLAGAKSEEEKDLFKEKIKTAKYDIANIKSKLSTIQYEETADA